MGDASGREEILKLRRLKGKKKGKGVLEKGAAAIVSVGTLRFTRPRKRRRLKGR